MVFIVSETANCSVYVLTYNSDPKKLKITLDSILAQDYNEFEILISDDGSFKRDHFSIIKQYAKRFSCIQVLENSVNLGTVKNQQKALEEANGDLLIGLSPGDALYSKNTLRSLVSFYEKEKPLFFVGYLRAYLKDFNGVVRDVNFMAPSPDHLNIMKNSHLAFKRLLYGNLISGAALVRTKKSLNEKLLQIPEGIKYLEDHPFFLLAAYNGYQIPVYDKYLIWYEYGSGVSTSKCNTWSERLLKDWCFFLDWLAKNGEKESKNNLIKKELAYLNYIKNIKESSKYRKKARKFVYCLKNNPQRLFFYIKNKTSLLSAKNAMHRKNLIETQGNGFLDEKAFFQEENFL